MCEKLAFFDFFESFVPPRNLRLLLHDAVIVDGTALFYLIAGGLQFDVA